MARVPIQKEATIILVVKEVMVIPSSNLWWILKGRKTIASTKQNKHIPASKSIFDFNEVSSYRQAKLPEGAAW